MPVKSDKEFYKIMYVAPNGKVINGFVEKVLRGFHPAELKSDETSTITIPINKIISMERV